MATTRRKPSRRKTGRSNPSARSCTSSGRRLRSKRTPRAGRGLARCRWDATRSNPSAARRKANIASHVAAAARIFKGLGVDAARAMSLALAEDVYDDAERAGVAEFEWEHDEDPDLSWMDKRQMSDIEHGRTEALSLVLRIKGPDGHNRVIDSLGGIVLGTNEAGRRQGRMSQAEMAHENLSALKAALAGAELRANPRRRTVARRRANPSLAMGTPVWARIGGKLYKATVLSVSGAKARLGVIDPYSGRSSVREASVKNLSQR